MSDQLIAHLRKKDKAPQFLWDHLIQVSDLTGLFAGKIGLKEAGKTIGLLHDLGKASVEFQNYIGSATGLIDPDADEYVDAAAQRGKVDHSSAGAQVIYRYLSAKGIEGLRCAQILSLCVASHHSGLIDCLSPNGENNFKKRMEKPEEFTHASEALSRLSKSQYSALEKLLNEEKVRTDLVKILVSLKEENESRETLAFKQGLLARFLLGSLLDADRLNTADFEFPANKWVRNYGEHVAWEILIDRLNSKLKKFDNKKEKNEIDEIRQQVSRACFEFATKPRGMYQLTVPTGGGKTLASLRFALNHAAHHAMDKVFYVIPYTSIIDQNAEVVRGIFEEQYKNNQYTDRVVLEHHSNLTPEEETYRQSLLAENWDARIIFTTQVQFLEALFGPGTRSARRMHQLANSVIIFDEIQTIPIRCVHMFNLSLRFLVNNCGVTAVLCTATQPLLDKIEPPQRALTIAAGQRMIGNQAKLFEKLRRVDVFDQRKPGGWSEDEVAELTKQELAKKGSVLVVVNTKRSARLLYQSVEKKGVADLYHLSTNMCPAHRLDVLKEVEKRLDAKEPVVCISTQLIEAGVDIDFGSVIRYLAGLDSIAQAAGRCNRNGRQRDIHGQLVKGNLWIVNPARENIDSLVDIKEGVKQAERVLGEFADSPEEFQNDRLGLQAMERYYEYYFYRRKDEMTYPVNADSPIGRKDNLFGLLSTNPLSVGEHHRIAHSDPDVPFRQSFRTASKAFHVIDSLTQGVVVPYEKGKEIINDLCRAYDLENQFKLLRRAQRFSVNLFPHEFKKMAENGAIREVQEGAGVFYLNDQYYSDRFGWSDEIVNDPKVFMA